MKKLQETREQKRMNNKGFSLVELIIVIAIMAVLIAILAPQFIKYVERGRQTSDVATVDEIIKAVEAEAADNEGISGGASITLQKGSAGTCSNTTLTNALKDNHNVTIGDQQLKSSAWGTVTIMVASDGACTVSSSAGAEKNMGDEF